MNKQRAFTLLELLIVVAIIAILAAIAWPNYQNYVVRGKRAAAASCLMEASQYMERFYTMNMRYDQTRDGTAVALPNMECITTLATDYTFSISGLSETAYTVSAAPQGMQATKDTQCATMGINQSGRRSVSGDGNKDKCWG